MNRIIVITAVASILFQTPSFAQYDQNYYESVKKATLSEFNDERLMPSYSEDSQYIYNHPEVDINVNNWFNTWKDSAVQIGHGGFAEQPIFTAGDPVNPPRKGACLTYIRAYNHGFLYGNEKTQPTVHDNEQVIFYVMKGFGEITAGGRTEEIREGTGIFIPAGLEYSFRNTSAVWLEVIIIVEGIPVNFEPRKDMVVKNYYDSKPGFCCWDCVTHSLFSQADGLAEPMSVAVITIDNLGWGAPHYHVKGLEEVWCKIKGEQNILILGKTLLRQNIGEAWLTPQNGYIPHAVINYTESPMAWLYFANRHDKVRDFIYKK